MTHPIVDTIIIIGTGIAGYSLAKEIRKIHKTCALVLITQDNGDFYSKPQLSNALFQGKSPQTLVITPLNEMQSHLNATIYTSSQVESIDLASQTVFLQTPSKRLSLSYSKLVLANGASPKPFPVLDNVKNHFRINNLQDYEQFICATEGLENLTIIGSGLVGCEFAQDFTKIFKTIHVITPDPYPLFGLVPQSIGEGLQNALTKQGICWHTHTNLTNVVAESDKLLLNLSSQEKIITNALLCAIGIMPNIQFAKNAGIETRQGILVNDHLQTSDPHIFALGDCAEISGVCRQYIAPILPCSRALAQTLCGTPTPVLLPVMPISLKVSSYPVITFVPPKEILGEWSVEKNDNGVKALFHDAQGTLQGYALSGVCLEARQTCMQLLGKVLQTEPV